MQNTSKVKKIIQTWFGCWITSATREADELLVFHLTDDGTIIFTVKKYVDELSNSDRMQYLEITEELSIAEFEKCFLISISELLKIAR